MIVLTYLVNVIIVYKLHQHVSWLFHRFILCVKAWILYLHVHMVLAVYMRVINCISMRVSMFEGVYNTPSCAYGLGCLHSAYILPSMRVSMFEGVHNIPSSAYGLGCLHST